MPVQFNGLQNSLSYARKTKALTNTVEASILKVNPKETATQGRRSGVGFIINGIPCTEKRHS
jgi:predicted lipoprotein